MIKLCVYCGERSAQSKDHVIAKQFFPKELIYRDNLPQAPACLKCNNEKSKIENIIGPLLQFGHDSEASRQVMESQLPRTFNQNKRLQRDIGSSLQEIQINGVKRLIINMSKFEKELYEWFKFVFTGIFYYFTQRSIFSDSLEIFLLKPKTQLEVDTFYKLMKDTPIFKAKTFSEKELKLCFAENPEENISMMSMDFKSISIFCLIEKKSSCQAPQ